MMAFPDFGNIQDNEIALHRAMDEIHQGSVAWGCEVLLQLREHIRTTRDQKSLQWILPPVENALQRFCDPEVLRQMDDTALDDEQPVGVSSVCTPLRSPAHSRRN